jgi:predicted ATP-grasp superfamily ATP-dependent carboligase
MYGASNCRRERCFIRSAHHLLIVGASARAAAFSALRAGLIPHCADLFADRDLQARCDVTKIAARSYPQGFLAFLAQAPVAPWIYTGGLENHPELIEKMATVRPLWGNNRSAVEASRAPWHIASLLRSADLPHPRLYSLSNGPSPKGRWLLKSLRSTGGMGVSWWNGKLMRNVNPSNFYLQEYIDGDPCSAVFIGTGEGAELIGLTRQLIGEKWLNAKAFRYCGSIGPLAVDDRVRTACHRLGEVVSRGSGLRGFFGIDFILRDNEVWPIEVNSRYTASVEILELAFGRSALARHCRTFDPTHTTGSQARRNMGKGTLGKVILFARGAIDFPSNGPWLESVELESELFQVPHFADIPSAGARIRAGRPVLTIFMHRASTVECTRLLKQTAREFSAVFGSSPLP